MLNPPFDYNGKAFADIVTFLCFGESAVFKDIDSILALSPQQLADIIENVNNIRKKQQEELDKIKRKKWWYNIDFPRDTGNIRGNGQPTILG